MFKHSATRWAHRCSRCAGGALTGPKAEQRSVRVTILAVMDCGTAWHRQGLRRSTTPPSPVCTLPLCGESPAPPAAPGAAPCAPPAPPGSAPPPTWRPAEPYCTCVRQAVRYGTARQLYVGAAAGDPSAAVFAIWNAMASLRLRTGHHQAETACVVTLPQGTKPQCSACEGAYL